MNWQDCITVDPAVLVGKPIIKGTRLSVEFMLGLIAQGWPEEEILRNYLVSRGQLRACVAYAQARVSEEKVFASAA
jgi:uncharacterized protein (DUF433 family)